MYGFSLNSEAIKRDSASHDWGTFASHDWGTFASLGAPLCSRLKMRPSYEGPVDLQ